jgi:phosphoadenosine phosphosulfate reductase
VTVRTREEVVRWAEALEGKSPEEILASVTAAFPPGRVGFATGFGPEGCVLVDVAARAGLPIDVFTIDTGALFPETYALWNRLEARYALAIRRVASEAADEPVPDGAAPPWEADPDRCCELRKVLPLRAELRRFDAWVTAIRRDQTPDRANAAVVEWDEKFGLVKVNPLVAWSSREVWDHLRAHEVPTNPLHDRGYPSIGCGPCTTPVGAEEDPRAGRWRGRAKKECGLHVRETTEPPTPTPTPTSTSTPTGSLAAVHPERSAVAGGAKSRDRGGYILWLTGLSGAGKSTLSRLLRPTLERERPVEILDGDEVRTYLSAGLGFGKEDRDTNVRRIGFVARLLARTGAAAVTAAISPYAATRDEVRALAERDGVPFVEVFVSSPVAALAARDVKGLYRKALAGEIAHFTGVSDPYEPPARPDVVVHTDVEPVEESARKILEHLRRRGLLHGTDAEVQAS